MSLSANDDDLIIQAFDGNLNVVRDLLLAGANVNAQRDCDGTTALVAASCNGHVEIVHILLQQNNIDVNIQRKNGGTALYMASRRGHWEVVRALLQHNKVDVNAVHDDGTTALDVARMEGHANILRLLQEYVQEEAESRTLLAKVMTTRRADPVELWYQYIKRCMTDRKLWSGVSGEVFLAEDSSLPKKFAVKMIKLPERSDGPHDENLTSLQMELSVRFALPILHGVLPCAKQENPVRSPASSNNNAHFRQTLKRLHHPNILDLYGYNVKGSGGEQFLVFEYAANGSLDGFLKDEGMRARLSASTRLSIMYQVARAVHFLHTGGAGFKVFHRDIKSANICLTEHYAPRLVYCGLTNFVEDEHIPFPSEPTKLSGSTEGPAIGTIGHMCPEYTSTKAHQIECDYGPAYDLFSFGVVIAELILGRLNGDQINVFETYALNGKSPIVEGWKRLESDADNRVTWNAGALELVCKIAIRCITPSSEGRLSTGVLLPLLFRAIAMNDGINDDVQAEDIDGVIAKFMLIKSGRGNSAITRKAWEGSVVHDECIDDILTKLSAIKSGRGKSDSTTNAVEGDAALGKYVDNLIDMVRVMKSGNGGSVPNGRSCSVCNESLSVVRCRGGSHPLCAACIDDAVVHAPASTTVDFRLPCLIDGCSSQAFTFKDLKRHIDGDVWIYHLTKQDEQVFNVVKELQKNVE